MLLDELFDGLCLWDVREPHDLPVVDSYEPQTVLSQHSMECQRVFIGVPSDPRHLYSRGLVQMRQDFERQVLQAFRAERERP